jgi:hypothetical protein
MQFIVFECITTYKNSQHSILIGNHYVKSPKIVQVSFHVLNGTFKGTIPQKIHFIETFEYFMEK